MKKIILLDLDDTLIRTQEHYDNVSKITSLIIAEDLGLDLDYVLKEFNKIDLLLMQSGKYAFNERYVISFLTTYTDLSSYEKFNFEIYEKIKLSANKVFSETIPFYDGALEFMLKMSNGINSIELLTLGDYNIQMKRLTDLEIEDSFNEIHITEGSKSEVMLKAINEVGIENVVMIGNSLRSDIQPALELGLKAIHIPRETWAYDKAEINEQNENYIVKFTFAEIVESLKTLNFI